MNICAKVTNRPGHHEAVIRTVDHEQPIPIPARENGGSSVNGGELLCLAMATCYCNDVYREAALRGIQVHEIEVEAHARFGDPGAPAVDVRYHIRVMADAEEREIRALLLHTDNVAEIQNTLRQDVDVRLGHVDVVTVGA
jgi:organic hydroperoxide reductase OsmC/OhrA